MRTRLLALSALALLLPVRGGLAQSSTPPLDSMFRWRMIGPHRGGRTVGATGVPGAPDVLYIGVNNGGVWRSTDYGRVWTPIFDSAPTGSVGAVAVAASDPKVLYVGSGEGLQRPDLSTGDGIYRSADGGKSWTNMGLRDAQQVTAIVVDPRDANRVYVAALGHPYGPNPERGVFRSTDGGAHWEKVLYRDENTGAFDVVMDPKDPQVLYAVLWAGRQAPWEMGGSWELPGGGLFKSTDGGTTWKRLTDGLPGEADKLGRIGLDVSRSDPSRLYAVVDAAKVGGIYRSDDGGEHWRRMATDPRLWGRGSDFAEVRVDPKDPDVVYVANVVTWKSTDGGATFTAFRGAPGGDDYHRLWIDPQNPKTIMLVGDQGAIVTQNAGETWSSWYNQPTAQFYHVSTDNAFPYRVCGGQQESGSVCIQSRGDDGRITFREWHPVGVEEYGYVAPDPLDPDIVYGGKVSRYDRRTGQTQQVGPVPLRDSSYRVVRTQPVLFSPTDPHTLYFASNVLWKTTNGGQRWTRISPDLTRARAGVPANLGAFAGQDPEKGAHRGVIYTIAPSYVDGRTIWVGNDDGLIHVTRNGGSTWSDVTPAALRDRPWSKVSIIDASHHDVNTAYAAVNTFRLDDTRPHILRTRDGGRSWVEITNGIPADEGIVNVVREDPKRAGLLFAGTERRVWFSLDDGDHWQPLRLNMPATSIRDLVIKDDDIVVGTHGRSFWILDDVTPLRQLADSVQRRAVHLFRPQVATRWRWNTNTDTPLPQEEPAGENPPDGAILDYWLGAGLAGPVTLEILDSTRTVVRRYSSDDPALLPIEGRNIPDYWIRPEQRLATTPGLHRFVWDLHWTTPAGVEQGYPISATYGDTPREPRGPWAVPGRYTVRLTTKSTTEEQPLAIRMDPRVKTPAAVLAHQLRLSRQVGDAIARVSDARFAKVAGAGRLRGELQQLFEQLQDADVAPTAALEAAVRDRVAAASRLTP